MIIFKITKISPRFLWNKISQLQHKMSKDNIFIQSAALAFYTALAMAPLMILFITLLGALKIDLQDQFLAQFTGLVGVDAGIILEYILQDTKQRPDLSSIAGWLGSLTLLFSASVIFAQIQTTLNTIFAVEASTIETNGRFSKLKNLLMRRLLCFGMVLSFLFIAMVSLIVSASLSFFTLEKNSEWAAYLNFFVNTLVFTALFSLIFKWMPDRPVKTKNSIFGGFLTAILFILGKELISLYLGRAAVGSAYGAAGSLVVLLVWVYYSSIIMFLGAEISAITFLRNTYSGKEYLKKRAA